MIKPQKQAIKCSSLKSIGPLSSICGWVVVVIKGSEEFPHASLYISVITFLLNTYHFCINKVFSHGLEVPQKLKTQLP